MKKLKLSLIAVALLGTVSAFATSSKATGEPCLSGPVEDSDQCKEVSLQLCCVTETATIYADFNP